MAKKTTKRKTVTKSKKAAARKPAARKRRVRLGAPSKRAAIVRAADSPEHPQPSVDCAKSDAAEGNTFTRVGDNAYEVCLRRSFSSEEVAALINVATSDESMTPDAIGRHLVDFSLHAIDDAVAEAEADTEAEQPRYQEARQPDNGDK